jgi:iron complex outermembrane receptor protein
MRLILTTFILWSLLIPLANAVELTGAVVDEQGQPIAGVSVVTDLSHIGTITDSAGLFEVRSTETITRLTFSCVGFYSRQLSADDLPETIVLKTRLYPGEDVVVTADRARPGLTPLAFDNYSADDIERDFTHGDLPPLLNSTPNFYSWSDAGGNMGYTYTQIRGFDDKRIAAYINGVPLNDPEDQFNYWVDLPDFTENVTDVQVQRGVGNSLYGDASFGGSINVVTNTLELPRSVELTSGFGEFLSDGESVGKIYKQSVQFASGLVDGRWAFSGRFSKAKTDGYRESSWVDSWAYYVSAARLDPDMSTELQVFGGPMRLHLTFLGVDRATLADNRRYNPLSYEYETDNFSQPHYHLHNTWRLNDRATLLNTVYFIRGKGHFEQRHLDTLFETFNISPSMTGGATRGDIVQRQFVSKWQLGWNPRLELKHDRGNHTLGGSFYYFESDHTGEVTWAQPLVQLISSRWQYYQYFGVKKVGSLYAQEYYRFSDRLSVQATGQLRFQRYDFNQVPIGLYPGFVYDLDWFFFSPRLGFNYKLFDEPGARRANLYLNLAVSSRTPTDAAIYDASDPYSFPSIEISDSSMSSGVTEYQFGNPTFSSERVYNIELGGAWRTPEYSLGVNLYWMDFTDEIIAYGGINPSNGQPATVNAEGSYRAGIEMQGDYRPVDEFGLSGSLSLNRYRIKDFEGALPIYDAAFNYVGDTVVSFEDVKGLGFPEYLANLSADYRRKEWRLTYRIRFIGRQYMELLNLEDVSIDPYSVSSLSAGYTVRGFLGAGDLVVTGTVDNLFDSQFEVSGYGWNYGAVNTLGDTPVLTGGGEYYVGAERSYFVQVRMRLF